MLVLERQERQFTPRDIIRQAPVSEASCMFKRN